MNPLFAKILSLYKTTLTVTIPFQCVVLILYLIDQQLAETAILGILLGCSLVVVRQDLIEPIENLMATFGTTYYEFFHGHKKEGKSLWQKLRKRLTERRH